MRSVRCTEFGAVTGIFVPDDITKKYIDRRKRKTYRSDSLYFKADEGAQYAGSYKIDLSEVEHSIAVYPNPDDVVPASEKQGLKLDGVFIGACTTTEEGEPSSSQMNLGEANVCGRS